MGDIHDKKEDWEKDFTGLELLHEIYDHEVEAFSDTAKALDMRIEFKSIKPGRPEVWTPSGRDLTDFWDKLEQTRKV